MGVVRALKRIGRLPARIRRNAVAVRTLRNWIEFLLADIGLTEFSTVRARNGVVIQRPPGANLKFLFDEIWLLKVYSPAGYEPRSGDVVIDIGANIGVFALYAASHPRTRVFSYEPFPASVASLRANVRASNARNVKVTEAAVAGSRTPRVLNTGTGNWVMHSLAKTEFGKWPGVHKTGSESNVEVRCVTLEDVFVENGIERCDLLKVDCEGSEYEIVASCPAAIWDRISRIVVEYHEGDGYAGTGEELACLLTGRGFLVERLEPAAPGTGYLCARNTRIV